MSRQWTRARIPIYRKKSDADPKSGALYGHPASYSGRAGNPFGKPAHDPKQSPPCAGDDLRATPVAESRPPHAGKFRTDTEGSMLRMVLHLLAGLIGAICVIAVGVLSRGTLPPVFAFVWTPATWLIQLSDVFCPPIGVKCVLGSTSQGAHHLMFALCLLGFWWVVLSIAVWPLFRQLGHPRRRMRLRN
jgi:hypothetical protein